LKDHLHAAARAAQGERGQAPHILALKDHAAFRGIK
jgi:hypothetical protein